MNKKDYSFTYIRYKISNLMLIPMCFFVLVLADCFEQMDNNIVKAIYNIVVGVRLQILEYLGERETAKLVLENYQSRMLSFIEQPISKRGLSASMLMHDYFPYNDSNMDFWYNFSVEMKPALKKSMEQLKLEATDSDDKEVYFVSVEDSEDE